MLSKILIGLAALFSALFAFTLTDSSYSNISLEQCQLVQVFSDFLKDYKPAQESLKSKVTEMENDLSLSFDPHFVGMLEETARQIKERISRLTSDFKCFEQPKGDTELVCKSALALQATSDRLFASLKVRHDEVLTADQMSKYNAIESEMPRILNLMTQFCQLHELQIEVNSDQLKKLAISLVSRINGFSQQASNLQTELGCPKEGRMWICSSLAEFESLDTALEYSSVKLAAFGPM